MPHSQEIATREPLPLQHLHRLVWCALLASLIAVGSYLHFPLGPVPISLQVCFVLLSGFVLGPGWGFAAVAMYVLAGLAGLPVYSGGSSGIGHILGPTGGYLLGFLAAPLITGLWSRWMRKTRRPWGFGVLACVAGYTPIYGLGLAWLRMSLDLSWGQAIGVGLLPFLPSDGLQILVAVSAAKYLHHQQLTPKP